jgi:AcrR family transcriptional regulator
MPGHGTGSVGGVASPTHRPPPGDLPSGPVDGPGRDAAGADPAPRRRRLPGDLRKIQLLDVAVELLAEGGPDAVTMEGVAARAGVSKTLGYRYFGNADELLVAVHRREMAEMGNRVRSAIAEVHGFEPQVRASLAAWLDLLAERGPVIASILAVRPVSSPVDEASRSVHAAVSEFYGGLAAEAYDLSPRVATVAASILLAGLEGLVDCWISRRMPRRELIDTYTTMCVAAFAALAADPPVIGAPNRAPRVQRARERPLDGPATRDGSPGPGSLG